VFYLALFWEPISALAQRYLLLQGALSGAERVFALLDVEAPDAPVVPSAPPGDRGLAVSFEDVDFAYKPGVPVLRHVNLSVQCGERVAFVGPTGSGKSTLVSLALRLYDVQSGVVRVLGDDVRGLERDEVRKRFSVVPQDVFLFPGTIAENVAAGDPLDETRVREVLERIGALEILARRPGGLEARVEEHAANFSSGERQIIAFARALYRDAPILMLDEATASIDSDTELRLNRAFEELTRGRTSLVVAHRLSTIRSADRIVVIQHGRIVEQGSHERLIASGGLYKKLYELQLVREAQPPSVDPASLTTPASRPSTSQATTRT
jgi:ATP-binding cassette subfamily B protein